ncbi:hypothetical protein QTP81_14720 [Alteromonas sp. ASW11-36]|uniref:Exonuclease domain-containing protein n=1 Tax=Alteromonas arenosi TaxID=3055817 RepID=A0ABT7T085_9ALTE|nr:hypothetical protein [Alteromonas sp. ASW11-36]MDM7861853.1 hypothetical protein [Alteromonas sp. ASW11-36]
MNDNVVKPLPSIIDIEASGFGAHSYPIEIGVVRDDGARFCRLIKPIADWLHWDEEAEKLHGISRQKLDQYGSSAVEVCLALNEFVGLRTLHSDGWVVDSPWMTKLYATAGCQMQFRLSPLESLLSEQHLLRWDSIKQDVSLEYGGARHRASVDAMIVQQTFAKVKHSVAQQRVMQPKPQQLAN